MHEGIPAIFRSVWDGGIVIETSCMVNPDTREVYNIETADVSGLDILESEFVVIKDEEYPVFTVDNILMDHSDIQVSDIKEGHLGYWYDI